MADDDVRTALAAFGRVTEVTRERWRVEGVSEKSSTTRTVLIKLNSGMRVDDLPHQIRVAGELALVVAPGRPMQCLRCNGTGHVRRECKVPRCSRCRRFGHSDAQCVRSYASVTGSAETEDATQHIMDVTEAEDAAKGSGDGSVAGLDCEASTSAGDATPEPTERALEPAAASAKASEEATKDLGWQVTGASASASKQDRPVTSVASSASTDLDSEEGSRNAGATAGSNAGGTAIKRPLEEDASQGDKNGVKNVEGPPAKTPAGRRTSLRARPAGTIDKKAVDNPFSGGCETGPPGGSGGV